MARGITKKGLNSNSINIGTITTSSNKVSAEGSGEYRGMLKTATFGIMSKPKVGQNLIITKPYSDPNMALASDVVLDEEIKVKDKVSGALKPVSDVTLQEGETLLYSEGGATIKLCNDGRIILNRKLVIKTDGTTEILSGDDAL